MKKIFKAVIRDIWHYHWRSTITFVAIFAVIAFPVAMFSVSPNISDSIDMNNENYKIAHLDVRFLNGNDTLVQLINESINESLDRYPEIIESRFLARGKARIGEENETWEGAQFVGIPKTLNHSINQFSIVSGNVTLGENEIFIIDSFAEAYSLTIGSNITVLIGPSEFNLTIVGLVRSMEYLSYEINQECVIYLDDELLHDLLGVPQFIVNSITIYFWEEITVDEITQCATDIQEVFDSEGIIILYQWLTREVSFSAILSNALKLASTYLNTSAFIIIIIVGIVIFIITKRYALEQRKQTGTLFAFGFSPPTILRAFLLRSFLICLLAMVFGVFGGYGLLRIIINILVNQWGLISVAPSLSPIIVLAILSSSLIMTIFFTYLAAKSNVNLTPYEALRGKVKSYSGNKLKFMSKWRNSFKYPIRNLFRNKGRSIMTFFAYAGSVMLAFSLIVAQFSVFTTKDVYFSEQVGWDVKAVFNPGFNTTTFSTLSNSSGIEEVELYLETLVQSENNLEGLVFLRGIEVNSSMVGIDLKEGNLFTNSTAREIIMSEYVAEQLGLEVGDPFNFRFYGQQINTTIVGLNRDLELTLSIYMQLEAMEEILGFSPHNAMLLKVNPNDTESVIEEFNINQEVSFALTKLKMAERINNILSSQTIIVNVMVTLGFMVSFLAIFATSFISSIEREREYALLRVFGYTSMEILVQLFIEIMILCVMSLILALTLGNFLALYWNSIISSIFFTIDLYQSWLNYLIASGFAILAVSVSIIPAFQLIIRQNLAEQINEE